MALLKRRKNFKSKMEPALDPMAVTWLENHDEFMSKVWNLIPYSIGKCIATVSVFVIGISINGDWLNIFVHIARQFEYIDQNSTRKETYWFYDYLQNYWIFWLSSCTISYAIYFILGGFLHWYYYIRQKDRAEEWKCQPKNWLTPELERNEIILGSTTLFLNASVSAILACYITNGGYSTVYYDIGLYGWSWFVLQFPVIFVYQDYCTYWLHRMYHLPYLYKRFHKLHHKYKHPTAFSVTAIHPVESLHVQLTLTLPLFAIPLHWFPFYSVALYSYYHGIIDHSGINFKAYWWQPWQPDAIFHDNHHQYFHVNFGFNIQLWDKIHGTYRRMDRIYKEDIFYGKGKPFDEVDDDELTEDLKERESEISSLNNRNKNYYNE